MTYQETVDQFVSDAAYRVGEIGMLLDAGGDDANADHQNLRDIRKQLSRFLTILRHTTMTIIDSTNFLDWTEREVLREVEYLRDIGGMNYLPIISFQNYAPSVLIIQGGGSTPGVGTGLPIGNPGDSIFYNASSQPIADAISLWGGWTGETINTYFSGRP